MKNVVLLIRNAAKSDFGGAETYQVSLASILKKEGFNPIVISRSKKLLSYASSHSISVQKGWWWSHQNWSGKQTLLFPLYLIWQAILTAWYIILIIRTRASILHIQSKDDFIAATIAGRIMNKRVIWTDHMDLRYILQNTTKPFRNPLGKMVFWSAHIAHKVILISNNEHKLVTSHFKKNDALNKQIIIVKNGVIDRASSIKNNPNSNKTPFTFCLASRIVTNKGVGEAIDAFIQLKAELKNSNAELAIFGEGPDSNIFRQKATNHDDIVFYGHQQNAIEKIASADVFMLPSYQEGFSIALLEATMLGKAIIASDVDSNSEIIKHGKSGLLVKARDSNQLCDAMLKLYTQPALKQSFEKTSRSNYERLYNLENIVKYEIIPLYSDL